MQDMMVAGITAWEEFLRKLQVIISRWQLACLSIEACRISPYFEQKTLYHSPQSITIIIKVHNEYLEISNAPENPAEQNQCTERFVRILRSSARCHKCCCLRNVVYKTRSNDRAFTFIYAHQKIYRRYKYQIYEFRDSLDLKYRCTTTLLFIRQSLLLLLIISFGVCTSFAY